NARILHAAPSVAAIATAWPDGIDASFWVCLVRASCSAFLDAALLPAVACASQPSILARLSLPSRTVDRDTASARGLSSAERETAFTFFEQLAARWAKALHQGEQSGSAYTGLVSKLLAGLSPAPLTTRGVLMAFVIIPHFLSIPRWLGRPRLLTRI